MYLSFATAIQGLALASIAVASPTGLRSEFDHIELERRGTAPNQWRQVDRISADAMLPMRIALAQQNLHLGDELLREISHPASLKFGQHLSAGEVDRLFAPSDETVGAITRWLERSGISGSRIVHSANRGWLAFDATVKEAEDLLQTKYHIYEHSQDGHKTVACEGYSIPKTLQGHIDYITPGVELRRRSSGRKGSRPPTKLSKREKAPFKPKANDTTTCDRAITPACIRALYQIPINTLSNAKNSLGIFEEGDFYAQEDLDAFFTTFEPRIPNGTHPKLMSIDGGMAPVQPKYADGESDLDFELSLPLIYPQKTILYQTDDQFYTVSGGGGIFNTFLDAIDGSYCNYTAFGETGNDALDDKYPDPNDGGYKGKLMCGKYPLTNVVSLSYSKVEADLPYYYQQRQCNEWMKLALQGHTVLIASGDFGVSSRSYDPDPNGCLGKDHTIFNPGFPSCPYVTIVGATKVAPGKNISDPEVAAYDRSHDGSTSAYSSGGGFSNIYGIPDYQKSAVATYFKNHKPSYKSYAALHNATHNDSTAIGANGGVYNSIGRGMPDVSANGQNIATYIDVSYKFGGYGLSEGTSASTPVFASIINNLNEHRLAAGKKPIGFLNHILYGNPQVFNDITTGTNPGCKTQGFSAVPGWDPVTGLGTPSYPKLYKLFMSLP